MLISSAFLLKCLDPLLPYAYLLAEYYLQHTINIIVQVIMHVGCGCVLSTRFMPIAQNPLQGQPSLFFPRPVIRQFPLAQLAQLLSSLPTLAFIVLHASHSPGAP